MHLPFPPTRLGFSTLGYVYDHHYVLHWGSIICSWCVLTYTRHAWGVCLLLLLLLRGTMVNRTYGIHKNLNIYPFLQQYLVILTMVPRNTTATTITEDHSK